MKQMSRLGWKRVNRRQLSAVVACLASMMLNGVPPQVCESVLDEVYTSVRKSFERIAV